MINRLLLAAGIVVSAGLAAAQTAPFPSLRFEKVAEGLDRPTHLASAADGSGRLFIAEQRGRIRLLKDGALLDEPFLDIRGRVLCCGERGLLSIAFPPGFAARRHFFAAYISRNGDEVISRFLVSPEDPDRADPGSETVLLTVPQPTDSHKGGQLAFSPVDGYLYLSLGDGSEAGDPDAQAQNPGTLLGKILRLDVASPNQPYLIPPDNPFARREGFRPEIWALGLRNPWRFSFDRANGDLYIADVGQNRFEEIDYQPASAGGGQNYGWNRLEASACFESDPCPADGLTPPAIEYAHGDGYCSVIGGFVYRGQRFPFAHGLYLFGDFCSGRIFGAVRGEHGWRHRELSYSERGMSTFGEDEAGEIYFTYYSEGEIYRILFDPAP